MNKIEPHYVLDDMENKYGWEFYRLYLDKDEIYHILLLESQLKTFCSKIKKLSKNKGWDLCKFTKEWSLTIRFKLLLNTIPICHIEYHNKLWSLWYSDEFKNQTKINPLVEFLDIKKVYYSKTLWPFLKVRIPPSKAKNMSEAEALKRYGKHCISNPFVLI